MSIENTPKEDTGIPGPSLFLFWKDNCPPCEALKPVIRDIARCLDVELKERKASEHMAMLISLGVRGVPAVVYLGKPLFIGNPGYDAAMALVKRAVLPKPGNVT